MLRSFPLSDHHTRCKHGVRTMQSAPHSKVCKLRQINSYGFREAIGMFAVLFLFHKIFMESETFD